MPKKVESKQLAVTFAVWSAFVMLVLWLFANMGLYVSVAEQMAKWHMFFNFSFQGLIAGMVEAAIESYILVLTFVWVYNWVGEKV